MFSRLVANYNLNFITSGFLTNEEIVTEAVVKPRGYGGHYPLFLSRHEMHVFSQSGHKSAMHG